jgi:hypothetical protein
MRRWGVNDLNPVSENHAMKLNQLRRSGTKSLRHGAALKTPENSRLRCIWILALLAYGMLPWQSGLGTPNARRRLERARGRVPGLLFVATLAGLLAGCTTTAPPPADPHLLDFLQDGQSTKQTVVLKLGQPSSVLESRHIMTYRVGQETDRGYFIREAVGTNWFAVKFSLVLVFDPAEVLERHSLVEVR